MNKIKNFNLDFIRIISSQNFLYFSCGLIFLLSIYLRSTIDIGADTGFYLSLAKKISEGGKYYYNFFESNFPISFYLYALQYRLSLLTGIDPIIVSEIFVNILALISIFATKKILERNQYFFQEKAALNLIIIACFLGFFLRVNALLIGEFGTKTSFFLILLFPYLAYNFCHRDSLSKNDLIWRGLLIGLMVCFKPHYAIFPIFLEGYDLWKRRSLKFFIEIDKLIAALVILVYINLMLFYTREYFEFMVPMWSEFYGSYSQPKIFIENSLKHLNSKIFFFSLITPIFLYLKSSFENKILLLSFFASCVLLIVENAGTIDQEVIFYTIIAICMLKLSYDFYSSKYFNINENKFVLSIILFLPFFDRENFFSAFFGILNIWWGIVFSCLIYLAKKKYITLRNAIYYLIFLGVLVLISMALTRFIRLNIAFIFNIIAFILFVCLVEKNRPEFPKKFSILLIIIFTSLNSFLFHLYFASVKETFHTKDRYIKSLKLKEQMAYHVKKFAPNSQESYVTIAYWIAKNFPLPNYLQKTNYYEFATITAFRPVDAGLGSLQTLFPLDKKEEVFLYSYLFEGLKRQIKNDKVKVIFTVSNRDSEQGDNGCFIGFMEYYLRDPYFRKLFFENFRFENRIVTYYEVEENTGFKLVKKDKFDSIKPSTKIILNDWEVYVRK